MKNKIISKFQRKSTSIMRKIFIPMFIALIFQLVVFFLFVFFGNITELVESNIYYSLSRKINSQAKELEYKVQFEWSNLEFYSKRINEAYENFLQRNNITSLQNNENLELQFLEDICPYMEGIIRNHKVNGAYIIICRDGDENQKKIIRNGISISDLDPTVGRKGGEDIVTQIGSYKISEKMGHILGINWSTKYEINSGDSFYFEPLQKNAKYPDIETNNLGCWDFHHNIPKLNFSAISYSVPMKLKNKKPYAVLGIEVSTRYISNLLLFNELLPNSNASYVFGLLNSGEKEYFEKIAYSGNLYDDYFEKNKAIKLSCIKHYDYIKNIEAYDLRDSTDVISVFSRVYFEARDKNYPETNKVALIGIVKKKDLFKFYKSILFAFITALLISALLAAVVIFFVANLIANPIVSLSEKLEKCSVNDKLNLTGVKEIDKLIFSIEDLNLRIKENQKTFSNIIKLSNLPIGAFKYNNISKEIYFTDLFFQLFEMPDFTKDFVKSIADYDKFISSFEDKIYSMEDEVTVVYKIKKTNGVFKYLRYKLSFCEERQLAIVMDITKEILEKEKIKQERDTDLLTQLLNRRAFMTNMENLFSDPSKLKTAVVLMLDVNKLKYVNDTFGHRYGDRLIQRMAKILIDFVNNFTIIARLGGDEVALFSYGFDSEQRIIEKIDEIEDKLENSYIALPNHKTHFLSISGGYSVYPVDGTDYHHLLRYADIAMYKMKKEETVRFVRYGRQ